jgi:hypothetical protein
MEYSTAMATRIICAILDNDQMAEELDEYAATAKTSWDVGDYAADLYYQTINNALKEIKDNAEVEATENIAYQLITEVCLELPTDVFDDVGDHFWERSQILGKRTR